MGQHVRNVPPTAPFPHAVKIRQHPRVEVDCGAAHALRVQPTAPLHMLSKEKKDSLTLLPQHHLDHFNKSSPGSVVPDHPRSASRQVHVHPCCRLAPVSDKRNARPPVLSPDACKRQAQRFPPGPAALAHPQSVTRFVSKSTPPESP